ncbi:MAG TPA: ABC transporter ATP-binding protein [Aggregatilineales bacterium]|nr:ABC transporter ATP-binding protein [Aggregatilineales bacterium]
MAESTANIILEVQEIQTFIGQFQILEGVTLSVPRGSITVILGRNGAGKTTTLKSIMGLTPPRQGIIQFEGKKLAGKRPFHAARLGIGYVPEHRAIFSELSVRENLEIAQRKRGDLDRSLDSIFMLFPDLKRLYTSPGGKLSGGQQQMLAIARALVPENRLLLIDEPSEGLAPVVIEHLMEAIRKLASQVTVLLVEQNFRMASQLADRYVIIDDGQSVSAGAMSDLLHNQALIQRYLGAA